MSLAGTEQSREAHLPGRATSAFAARGMDKLKRVLSGQDAEEPSPLAEVRRLPNPRGLLHLGCLLMSPCSAAASAVCYRALPGTKQAAPCFVSFPTQHDRNVNPKFSFRVSGFASAVSGIPYLANCGCCASAPFRALEPAMVLLGGTVQSPIHGAGAKQIVPPGPSPSRGT